jgi:hypothetical protein
VSIYVQEDRSRAGSRAGACVFGGRILHIAPISKPYFYKLLRTGGAPRVMRVGARTLISVEAAADWRRDRESATEAAQSNTT